MRSEFEWIQKIRQKAWRPASDLVMGIGDDAAILARSPTEWWLVTTDGLIENVHFRRAYMPARLLGHKSLAVNLSDIAAMGGRPRFFLLALALPEDLDSAYVEELLEGIVATADRYETVLIGGNLTASGAGLVVNVTLLGECAAHRALRREGARPGDLLYVTGQLGLSALGLKLLVQGYRPDETTPDLVRRALWAHLAPEPRLEIGRALAEEGLARAMIDVSDGISSDLWRLCQESRVGALLWSDALPLVPEATSFGADPLELALHGGEDYELLFAVAPEQAPRLEELATRFPAVRLTRIGRVTDEVGRIYLERAGGREPLLPRGYDHFRARAEGETSPLI